MSILIDRNTKVLTQGMTGKTGTFHTEQGIAYGTQFVVQTSSNLATWANVDGSDVNLANTAGSVTYTLTGSGKQFVRLAVTPD